MELKFYYDIMSQPCRAVYMFLKLNQVPYEDKMIAIRKKEHLSEKYSDIHPFNLVPALEDNGFLLTESIAIVDYISKTRTVEDSWYPASNPRGRARVSEYLHWQHSNTRQHCSDLFNNLLIIPRATTKPVDQVKVTQGRESVRKVVKNLESYFLRDTLFLSSDVITVADLFGACELMQLYAVLEEGLYESSPVVKAWMERVCQQTNPVFDNAHRVLYQVRETYKRLKANL